MRKLLYFLNTGVFSLFFSSVFGQNCPGYSTTVSSASNACGNQQYIFEVANTSCNGTISFTVQGNYGSSFANEITWNVTSQQTGGIVASGGPGTNGANINVTVGPLNYTTFGNIYTITVNDSWGDGFNGTGGFLQIVQGGTVIAGPVTGNFGAQWSTMFGANINISPVTVNITTPSGVVAQTVSNCNDINIPFELNTSNFCTTTNISLPWSITCNSTGATIASGNHPVTLYPSVPDSYDDLVNISWNAINCAWDIVPQNDCLASHIGSVFNISPDPSVAPSSCSSGNQTFNVTYNGVSGGPDCCATGGPLVPYTYNFNSTTAVASTSPFFAGGNHAALLTVPPSGQGGNTTSSSLNIN